MAVSYNVSTKNIRPFSGFSIAESVQWSSIPIQHSNKVILTTDTLYFLSLYHTVIIMQF